MSRSDSDSDSDSVQSRIRSYIKASRDVGQSGGQRRARYEIYAIIADALREARREPEFKRALWGRVRNVGDEKEFLRKVRARFLGSHGRTTDHEMDKNIERIWVEGLNRERVIRGLEKYGQQGFASKNKRVQKVSR